VAELAFPLAAIGVTFFMVIPLLTLMSVAVLRHRRSRETIWARFGSGGTFALLVAPTAVPLLWLGSSAAHQSEPSQALESCLLDHIQGSNCADALILAGVVGLGLLAAAAFRARSEWPNLSLNRLGADHPLQLRLAEIVSQNGLLAGLRVDVVASSPEPVFTTGWLRTRCYLDACFVESSDDKMLSAALLHERAHISAYDNLRCFAVRLALAVNPLGRLLASDFARWRQAREADCDSHAVFTGGEPLALAESIIQAAKFRCAGPLQCGVAALCGTDVAALKLRVALLLDGPPRPQRTTGHLVLLTAVAAALIGPHMDALAFVDQFHLAVERLVHS